MIAGAIAADQIGSGTVTQGAISTGGAGFAYIQFTRPRAITFFRVRRAIAVVVLARFDRTAHAVGTGAFLRCGAGHTVGVAQAGAANVVYAETTVALISVLTSGTVGLLAIPGAIAEKRPTLRVWIGS